MKNKSKKKSIRERLMNHIIKRINSDVEKLKELNYTFDTSFNIICLFDNNVSRDDPYTIVANLDESKPSIESVRKIERQIIENQSVILESVLSLMYNEERYKDSAILNNANRLKLETDQLISDRFNTDSNTTKSEQHKPKM